MSNFGHRSIRGSQLEMSNSNSVTNLTENQVNLNLTKIKIEKQGKKTFS